MAGVIAPHTRRGRRAATATATAPVEPAIAASAERAAVERDPTATVDVGSPPVTGAVPATAVPIDAAVLPEPTLVAEAGVPQPIVTASPILAIEPGAIDVVQADAAAARVAAGIDPSADPAGPHSAAAGQPTLTIQGSGAARAAERLAEGALGDDVADRFRSEAFVPAGDDRLFPEFSEFSDDVRDRRDAGGDLTIDDVVSMLQLMAADDPDLLPTLRAGVERFFGVTDATRPAPAPLAAPGMVAIVEVVGPLQGRRRAGRSFGPQATRFLASELSADEIAALRADPLLAVGVTEVAQTDIDPALYG